MQNPDIHSRLIGWLKIVLPLAALAVLSTLFLVARTINPDDAIPYADVDVSERLAQPRMTAPTYAGVTEDGAALTLSADEARPEGDTPDSSTAKALIGLMETPDGGRTDLVAAAGVVDNAAGLITLSGGVDITSSTGWRVQTELLRAAMDRTLMQAPQSVVATGPAGTITANSMQIGQDSQTPGRYVLVFNGAVKLIYLPAQ